MLAGATTALLAVFACVMLCRPLAPAPGSLPLLSGRQLGGQVAPYSQLPAGRAMMGGGRVLSALPPVTTDGVNGSTHAQAVEVVRGGC